MSIGIAPKTKIKEYVFSFEYEFRDTFGNLKSKQMPKLF